MITHDNLATIATQLTTAWRWTASDTLLLTLPLFHLHGLGSALNGTLVAGARALLRERFEVNDALATMRGGEVTMFFGVPTMYVRLLEAAGDGPVPQLRLFVSGSAALSADVHRAFEARFGSAILERYGATEFGFPLTNRYGGRGFRARSAFRCRARGCRSQARRAAARQSPVRSANCSSAAPRSSPGTGGVPTRPRPHSSATMRAGRGTRAAIWPVTTRKRGRTASSDGSRN